MVESFLCAHQKSTTIGNIQNAFENTGMCPFNPRVPLSSQYAVPPTDNIYSNIQKREDLAKNKLLTSQEGLDFLARLQLNRNFQQEDIENFNLSEIWARLNRGEFDDAISLSPLRPFLRVLEDNELERIFV